MRNHLSATNRFSLIIIGLRLPLILWTVCQILPTFDDFTTLQSPWWVQIADPGYFFPDSVRRPFDALLGAVVGWQPALFPTLNHVLIILGHAANALMVFVLCKRLKLGNLATNIATLFFFFSPATLGATLACDGFNQTYAQFWGLMALLLYLQRGGGLPWLLCIVMAAFSKENGLAWAVVPPVVAFAFGLAGMRQAARDVGKGLALAVAYFLLMYFLIHSGIAPIEYPEEYSETTLMNHAKDLAQLLAYTWVPLDYMSAVYAPTRNLLIVAVTAAMALPFLLLLLNQLRRTALMRRVGLLAASFFILASPHLVTVVSIMHNYAALSIAAIIVAVLLSDKGELQSSSVNGNLQSVKGDLQSPLTWFVLFLAAALFTDVHHYIAARDSGLLGKRLAMQAIEACPTAPRQAFVISVDDPGEPHYSSFCVRPADAFAWGLSVRHYTGYAWQVHISETVLQHYDDRQARLLADSALQAGNDVVWVVGHKDGNLEIIAAKPTALRLSTALSLSLP